MMKCNVMAPLAFASSGTSASILLRMALCQGSYSAASNILASCILKPGEREAEGPALAEKSAFAGHERLELSKPILTRQFIKLWGNIGRKTFRCGRPKRIGVLALSGMGGSGKVAREYAQAMAEAGHRVYLYEARTGFFSRGSMPGVSVLKAGVPSEPSAPDPSWTRALAQDLYGSILREDIEVLHVHYVAGLLESALIAKQLLSEVGKSIKVIATLHGTDVSNFGKDPKHSSSIARQLGSCDAVTAVSAWLAAEAKKLFGLSELPKVIWNSVDITRFNPGRWSSLRQRLAPHGERVLCHVSNLRPVKRVVDTVDVHAQLLRRGIRTRLILIGDGPDAGKALERAKELGTGESVMLTGPLSPDLTAKHIAASDLALVTSASEGCSLFALEAMASGVPVVGTSCGGNRDVVDGIRWKADGVSMLLAGVGDVVSMAKICGDLLQNSELYWLVQLQGVLAAFTLFHPDLQIQSYLNLVDKVGTI